ncbi:MAG TPA: hypothetical protein VJQ57_09485 [Acidimicrobiia bacterium]|nr:hypothetical protein [Acidimicrobiia bacterium]
MNPVDFFGQPVADGAAASVNFAMFFACPQCGACVVDIEFSQANRTKHHDWHRAGRASEGSEQNDG